MTKRVLKTLGVIGDMRLFASDSSYIVGIFTKILCGVVIVIINSVNKMRCNRFLVFGKKCKF